jgi:hypothetical protein
MIAILLFIEPAYADEGRWGDDAGTLSFASFQGPSRPRYRVRFSQPSGRNCVIPDIFIDESILCNTLMSPDNHY